MDKSKRPTATHNRRSTSSAEFEEAFERFAKLFFPHGSGQAQAPETLIPEASGAVDDPTAKFVLGVDELGQAGD